MKHGINALVILEAGQDQYLRVRAALVDYPGSLNPIHHRHDDIHQDDIGLILLAQGDTFLAISALSNQPDIGRLGHDRLNYPVNLKMVVDKDNANGSFSCHVLGHQEGLTGSDSPASRTFSHKVRNADVTLQYNTITPKAFQAYSLGWPAVAPSKTMPSTGAAAGVRQAVQERGTLP